MPWDTLKQWHSAPRVSNAMTVPCYPTEVPQPSDQFPDASKCCRVLSSRISWVHEFGSTVACLQIDCLRHVASIPSLAGHLKAKTLLLLIIIVLKQRHVKALVSSVKHWALNYREWSLVLKSRCDDCHTWYHANENHELERKKYYIVSSVIPDALDCKRRAKPLAHSGIATA